MIRHLLILSCLWLACTPVPGPSPIPPLPDADSAAPSPPPAPPPLPMPDALPPPVADCSACVGPRECACCALRALRCPEGDDTPKGETCIGVYQDRAAFPGLEAVTAREMACVGKATSRAQVIACGVRCQ